MTEPTLPGRTRAVNLAANREAWPGDGPRRPAHLVAFRIEPRSLEVLTALPRTAFRVAPAGSLEDALELTGPGRPCDLIMVGCAVCRQSSPDRLAALQRHRPDRRIGMLCGETAQCTGDVAIHLLRLGLAGIFPISLGQTALASAIRLVLDGGRYAPPEMLVSLDPHGKRLDGGNGGLLAARGHSWGAAGGHGECPDKPVADGRLAALSRREREVALLLAQGLANKEIAWRLELQEVTIKVHATSIYRKLGVRNRAQAVVKLLAAAKAEAAEA